MLALGRVNSLTISRIDGDALIIDGGEWGELLLTDAAAAASFSAGQMIEVFVYIDGNNQLQVTRQRPTVQVDEVAYLKVVSLSHAGAFLDWGLPKDLLLPFSEQKGRLVEGRRYVVRVFLDESNRIAASMLLNDFIQDQNLYLKAGQAVSLLIAEETELGFKAVVNHQVWGLLYKNDLFQPLSIGQSLPGFIKVVRADNKLDLSLSQARYGEKVDSTAQSILDILQQHGGYLAVTDKSAPEAIYREFKVSKKVFKQAIGGLYKQRRIAIEADGIRLSAD
jgi:predicted RNA-binding protein (virulence factor B family)